MLHMMRIPMVPLAMMTFTRMSKSKVTTDAPASSIHEVNN